MVNTLNPANFRKISQHKLAEKAMLESNGIPTPRHLGFIQRAKGFTSDGSPLYGEHHFNLMLGKHLGERICFKQAEGSGGKAFKALDIKTDSDHQIKLLDPISKVEHTPSEWWDRLQKIRGGVLIEEYIFQNSTIAELNVDSVNTLRLLVLEESDSFSTRGAILRIGRKGSQVDNTSNGGIACPIDLATGRVREALDLTPWRTEYTHHPDTGVPLIGLPIPYWKECVKIAELALSIFPRLRFAGVDVAIGANGPCVIELNADPDRRFATHIDIPHKAFFRPSMKH